MVKDKQKQDDKQPMLHLRLTGKVRADVDNAAKAAGRTLTKEVERRQEASEEAPKMAAPGPDTFAGYGWVDPRRAKALGDAVGVLIGNLLDYVVPAGDQAATLGMIQVAVADLLNGLGASADLTDDQKASARLYAQQVLLDIKHVEPDPTLYTSKPYLAVFAALVQAWGLNSSTDSDTDTTSTDSQPEAGKLRSK